MEKVRKYVAKIKAGYLKQAFRELKWIYHFAGRYRSSITLITVLRIVCAMLNMSLVIPERALVDAVVAAEWSTVIRSALIFMAILVIIITLTTIGNRKIGKTGARIKKKVAAQTYDRIMRADWETVVQHHSGDLLTRVQEDVGSVSSSTVGWIPMVIYSGIQVLLAVAYIVYFDVSMLVPMLLMAPLMILWPRKYLGRQYEANQRERKIASRLMALYKESFQHLQSIKGFGLIDLFNQKMEKQLEQRRDVETEINRHGVTAWVIMYSSGELASALCLAWAVYRVYQGRLTLGTLVLMITAAGTLSNALKEMMSQLPDAIRTISSSERLRGLLELPEEKVENAPAYDRMNERAKKDGISVSIQNLDFSYADGTEVLRGVNCDIHAGEIVAFVGPSGEGKTTMLRILLGIVHTQNPPMLESGGMSLPVSPAARRLMAYVPQGNTMLNGTIEENMRAFRQNATDEEIIAALKEACAYEFVEKLPDGINHNIGEGGIGFSEGQNQRLAIARALMCDTPILLLDEATSALDVATERRVLNSLMKGERKRTCILTTHRPSVLSMCSRVYRIAAKSVRPVGEDEVRQIMNEF